MTGYDVIDVRYPFAVEYAFDLEGKIVALSRVAEDDGPVRAFDQCCRPRIIVAPDLPYGEIVRR